MLKVYIANTDVAFTINYGDKRKRISFTSKSGNEGSVFFTSDELVQKGIEVHPWYNDKVMLREEVDEEKLAAEAAAKKEEQKAKAEEALVHHVDSPNEAKDYLADKFGISRSKMRSVSSIIQVAKECGVILEGLDNE